MWFLLTFLRFGNSLANGVNLSFWKDIHCFVKGRTIARRLPVAVMEVSICSYVNIGTVSQGVPE